MTAAHRAGVRVVPIPGASATTTLVSAAGLPDGRFLFEGFLPSRPKQRRQRLAELDALSCPFLIFEAPHRIEETAADLEAAFEPERELVVGRELTKQFEQVVRMRIGGLPAWLAADPNRRRGEFALLVFAAAGRAAGEEDAQRDLVSEIGARAMAVLSESMPPRQAARVAARISGDAADALYRRAVSDRQGRREAVTPQEPPDAPDDAKAGEPRQGRVGAVARAGAAAAAAAARCAWRLRRLPAQPARAADRVPPAPGRSRRQAAPRSAPAATAPAGAGCPARPRHWRRS